MDDLLADIRLAEQQRDIARRRGYPDVAAYWQDFLDILNHQREHRPVQPVLEAQ